MTNFKIFSSEPAAGVRISFYEPHFFDQVCGLYRIVFGADAAVAFQARWNWAQQDNLCPGETPKWILLAGERVVGFLATIPLYYRMAGRDVLAHTPCDYMVHPDYRFHGIKLMREFFRTCDNCVACDEIPATIKVTKWLGAKQAGVLQRYAKVLDARALRRGGFRAVPDSLWRVGTLGLRWYDSVRAVTSGSNLPVETVHEFDERSDLFFEQISRNVPASVMKDCRFLNWRYGLGSPHSNRGIGVITNANGELQGYVIFYSAEHPPQTGYLLDLQVIPGVADSITNSLLNYALECLRRSGAWVVQFHRLSSPHAVSQQILQDNGFVARSTHQFLVKIRDESLHEQVLQQENWMYSFGDSESSHAII